MARNVTNKTLTAEQEIRALVQSSRPGVRLPSETLLSQRFKIARMTVNKLLAQMQSEGLIVRRRGSGTFVQGSSSITFLIPIPDFFSNPEYEFDRDPLQRYLAGALQQSKELNAVIEIFAASKSNSREELDWNGFKRFNSDSMLIVPGTWFYRCFPLLAQKRSRVAFLDHQSRMYGTKQYTANWIKLTACRRDAVIRILERFRQAGCRYPAIASPCLMSAPTHDDIYYDLPLPGFAEKIIRIPTHCCFSEKNQHLIASAVRRAYDRHKFDCLIVDDSRFFTVLSIHRYLDLPESVKICALHIPQATCKENVVANGTPPFEKMGADAVKLLLQSPRSKLIKKYDYIFSNMGLLD